MIEVVAIQQIVEWVSSLGFVGVLIVLAIPRLKNKLFNGGDNGKALKEIKENHLHDMTAKLDKLISLADKQVYLLEDIKRKVDKE